MVHLYGLHHGGHWIDFLSGYQGDVRIFPTPELLEDLSRFPKGTRVGLEHVNGTKRSESATWSTEGRSSGLAENSLLL